eukprot:6208068-Amphidinium_carterae.1
MEATADPLKYCQLESDVAQLLRTWASLCRALTSGCFVKRCFAHLFISGQCNCVFRGEGSMLLTHICSLSTLLKRDPCNLITAVIIIIIIRCIVCIGLWLLVPHAKRD